MTPTLEPTWTRCTNVPCVVCLMARLTDEGWRGEGFVCAPKGEGAAAFRKNAPAGDNNESECCRSVIWRCRAPGCAQGVLRVQQAAAVRRFERELVRHTWR